MELLISVVVGVLIVEVYAWLPNISKRLLERAICRLCADEQERWREEWSAHLDALPNTLAKLIHALTLNMAAERINAEIFETECDEIGSTIKELFDKHRSNKQKIHTLKTRIADLSRRNLLEKSVASINEIAAPVCHSESVGKCKEALKHLGHSLVRAINRACELTAGISNRQNVRIDEADNLMKILLEKHANIVDLSRRRKLSTMAFASALEDLNCDLDKARICICGDDEDDADKRDLAEHHKIMTAIHSAIENLRAETLPKVL